MEDMLVLASFWTNLFYAARIIFTVAAFVAATAVILYVGAPLWAAVGIGLIAGVATYAAVSYFKPVDPPPPPPPPPVITTEYRISIDFSPGSPHTIPYECNIHNAKIVTTTQGEKSDVQNFTTVKSIHASDGKDFEAKFNNYLTEELKPLGDELRSITIYEEPFPGETPLDMMYIACKEKFPDTELHTTQ